MDHRSSTSLIPTCILLQVRVGRAPTHSVEKSLSTVQIRETLTTEFFGRPEIRLERRTLPGASERARLDVITATTTVRMLLWLNASGWTTSTGRRFPGVD